MANKYSNWNKASNYSNRNNIIYHLPPYIKVPELFQPKTNFILENKPIKNSTTLQNLYLNLLDTEIITRIACSYGLTTLQLKIYLQLAGYHISQFKLEEYLYRLAKLKMICHSTFKDLSCSTANQKSNIVTQYWYLAPNGYDVAKEIEAPIATQEKPRPNYKNYGQYDFALSNILWNQIIINQLLYSNNLKNFQIHTKESLNDKPFYVPLKLRTTHNLYIFEYICDLSFKHNHLQEILSQWISYKKEQKIPFTLVFVCKNNILMNKLKKYFNTSTISQFPLLFSKSEEWFQNTSGKLYTQTEYNGHLAQIIIEQL